MAYGTPAGVAAFARAWTDNGSFTDPDAYTNGTNPTLTQVEDWLEEVSVMVDLALGSEGFTVPVVQETAIKALNAIVNALVADLAHAANSSGRFFTERVLESGKSSMAIINADVQDWVIKKTDGLVAMGVPHIVDVGDQGAFSVQMTRAGSTTGEEYARPRFLIRKP